MYPFFLFASPFCSPPLCISFLYLSPPTLRCLFLAGALAVVLSHPTHTHTQGPWAYLSFSSYAAQQPSSSFHFLSHDNHHSPAFTAPFAYASSSFVSSSILSSIHFFVLFSTCLCVLFSTCKCAHVMYMSAPSTSFRASLLFWNFYSSSSPTSESIDTESGVVILVPSRHPPSLLVLLFPHSRPS